MTLRTAFRAALRCLTPAAIRRIYWRSAGERERRRILAGKVHEPRLCAAVVGHSIPGGTCLDIGGNCGLVTVPMAQAVGPTGRVIAFEPMAHNVERLRQNIAHCGVADRVDVVQTAVTDRCADDVPIFPGRGRSDAEWNVMGVDADGVQQESIGNGRSVAIDDYLDPAQRVDLVKIDVEGAEVLVLRGMTRTLDRWAPVLVIECHSEANWRTCTALRSRGYTLTSLAGETLTGDDWRYAHFVAVPPGAGPTRRLMRTCA